jgi:hypothetical protein
MKMIGTIVKMTTPKTGRSQNGFVEFAIEQRQQIVFSPRKGLAFLGHPLVFADRLERTEVNEDEPDQENKGQYAKK